MSKLESVKTFKRLRNRYRLVIMNDDTYEEVTTFKLNRLSVYIGMSTFFVLLVGFTIAMISFTPLKFLIPGFGQQSSLQELRQLKLRTDSMEIVMEQNRRYFEGIEKVLRGESSELIKDTTSLKLPLGAVSQTNPD